MGIVESQAVVDNLAILRDRISRAGGSDVEIVAVTKTFGIDAVEAAMAAGLTCVGENYAQECVAKLVGHDRPPLVHFIGHLQRNKIRKLAPIVDVWQSVDRFETGVEIAKRAPGAKVMVQVDISGEESKSGLRPHRSRASRRTAFRRGARGGGVDGNRPTGPTRDESTRFQIVAIDG